MPEPGRSLDDAGLEPIQTEVLPSVLMFQPTHYEVIRGDRLEEWERLMSERVGLRPHLPRQGGGSPSISWCDGLDDCDEI
jgi:hypothetical protein